MNYHHGGRFLTHFRIDNETVDLASAVLDLDPLTMARRLRKFLLRPILRDLAFRNRIRIQVHVMMRHVLRGCCSDRENQQADGDGNEGLRFPDGLLPTIQMDFHSVPPRSRVHRFKTLNITIIVRMRAI